MVVAASRLLPVGENAEAKARVGVDEKKLWSKCFDSTLRFDDQSSWCNVDGNFQSNNSSSSSTWGGGAEAMDACRSGISKCFLVPMWWGSSFPSSSSSGQAASRSSIHHNDRLHKHLVLSNGANGPSARIVLWRNYMGFDCREVRRNLGTIIRAHDTKRQLSEVEDVENENQSFLGTMLGTAVSSWSTVPSWRYVWPVQLGRY